MHDINFFFSGELNNFLHKSIRNKKIVYPLNRKASVKDIIESFGVPHTEVGRILVGENKVDFNFIPETSEKICIFPVAIPFDVKNPSLLRPEPLKHISFVVDVNVGKLAILLRLIGQDVLYSPMLSDREMAFFAHEEKRIVLTRDLGLLKRKQIIFGRYIKSAFPDEQLTEVIRCFGIKGPYNMFSRCLRCNSNLKKVKKEDILHRLKPKTKKYYNEFSICPECRRIYWQGSHCEKIKKRVEKIGIVKF